MTLAERPDYVLSLPSAREDKPFEGSVIAWLRRTRDLLGFWSSFGIPRCLPCGKLGVPQDFTRGIERREAGVYAVVLRDDFGFYRSLEPNEFLELFGARYALSVNRLYAGEEAPQNFEGIVLYTFPANAPEGAATELRKIRDRYSDRTIDLFYFSTREAEGERVTGLHSGFACPTCGRPLKDPRQLEQGIAGEGLIGTEWGAIEVGGVPLSDAPYRSFEELRLVIGGSSVSADHASCRSLTELTAAAAGCASGSLVVGKPLGLLARGERQALARLSAALSGVMIESPDLRHALPAAPETRMPAGGDRIEVGSIAFGPFVNEHLSAPIGGITLLCGPSGSGKTILLREILPARFRVRKQEAALTSFGPVRRVLFASCYEPSIGDPRNTLATAVSIDAFIAESFVSLPQSRRMGLRIKDFLTPPVDRRCGLCAGEGVVEGGSCALCAGSRVAGDIARLHDGVRTYRDYFSETMGALGSRFITSEILADYVQLALRFSLGKTRLGEAAICIDPGTVRLMNVLSILSSRLDKRHHALILIDDPDLSFIGEQETILMECLTEIVSSGNTVIVASREPFGASGMQAVVMLDQDRDSAALGARGAEFCRKTRIR